MIYTVCYRGQRETPLPGLFLRHPSYRSNISCGACTLYLFGTRFARSFVVLYLKKLHYGWTIAFLGALVFAINSFAIFGFGVFLKPMTDYFGWERGAISGAFSVAILIHGFLSIVTGRLSDRYGPRVLVTIAGLSLGAAFFLMSRLSQLWQVYLFWGIFVGLGMSCSVVPIVSSIPRWFVKNRGTAMAIPSTGFAFGAVVAPLFIDSLISRYGWQQAFVILAFIPAIVTPIAAQFLKRDPGQMGIELYGGAAAIEEDPADLPEWSLSFTQAVKTVRFWAFGLMHFCAGFYLQTVTVHIVPRAIDVGNSEVAAAAILSIIAGTSAFGRFFSGVLADKLSSRKIMSACLFVMALALVILLFARQVWAFSTFATVFGLASGAFVTLLAIVVSDLFGLKSMGAILGAIMLFGTVGGAVGAPLSGHIFDVTGSYNVAFTVGIVIAVAAAGLSLVLLRPVKKGPEVSPFSGATSPY